MNYLNKLERKFGRYAIPNLSKWLIIGYAIGYMCYYTEVFTGLPILEFLMLDPAMVLRGQVWRLVTWVVMPPSLSNVFFYVIMMMLYYQLGNALERTWGTFRFNAYIFGGVIFTVAGVMIMHIVMRFLGIIPVKIKWLAVLYAAMIALSFLQTSWTGRIMIVMSLMNFLIFFLSTRDYRRVSPSEIKRKRDFRAQTRPPQMRRADGALYKHKCSVCGRTDLDDPSLEFRFCSKCEGSYEYCQEHLFTHEHRKKS